MVERQFCNLMDWVRFLVSAKKFEGVKMSKKLKNMLVAIGFALLIAGGFLLNSSGKKTTISSSGDTITVTIIPDSTQDSVKDTMKVTP